MIKLAFVLLVNLNLPNPDIINYCEYSFLFLNTDILVDFRAWDIQRAINFFSVSKPEKSPANLHFHFISKASTRYFWNRCIAQSLNNFPTPCLSPTE